MSIAMTSQNDNNNYTNEKEVMKISELINVKIVNGSSSLQKVLDKTKGASMRVIKEDREKPLRGVAYLERFRIHDNDDNLPEKMPIHLIEKAEKLLTIHEKQSQCQISDQTNVDDNVVGLVSSSCVNTNTSDLIGDHLLTESTDMSGVSGNDGAAYHFNLEDSPHWNGFSENPYGCDNRDARDTLAVGASATMSKDSTSFTTCDTSPDPDDTLNGNTYGCGNIDESREPLTNVASSSSAVTPSSSTETDNRGNKESPGRSVRKNKRE